VLTRYETLSDPALNWAAFEEAMRRAGNTRHQVMPVAGAEHSLMAVARSGEQARLQARASVPDAFDRIVSWSRAALAG